jgi:hypothetical protein
MQPIPRFSQGDSQRTAFSAEVMNEIIDALNAFIAIEGAGGIRVYKSDNKIVIAFSGSVSGSGGGGGNITQVTQSYGDTIYCLPRWA